ncbi:MAG: hypothetical protein IK093_10175 [Ruminiclostridium sp.]|nr:hypothetical protein [Ruminiclostridium sp.]
MKKYGFLKLFALILAAVTALCSCGQIGESASKLVDAVVSSAGAELSSALSEGIEEFSEGVNDLKDGLVEVSSGLEDAGSIISSHIDNIAESVGSQVSDELAEITQAIGSIGSELSDSFGSVAENIGSELSEAADSIITSSSSDDTTASPVEQKHYTFRNKARFDEHYKKHGKEFGNITQDEYLDLANELIASTSDRVLHKFSDDGDYMYFDQDTNHFLVLSEDGYIRTFFIPSSGINYWNRQ